MSKFLLLFVCSVFMYSCKNDAPVTPKVRYEKTAETKDKTKIDSSTIVVADLPIHFSETAILLYPVGEVVSSKRGGQSFTVSNNNDFQITGYLKNLHFQKIKSDSISVLTDKQILIETATFLKSIADKYKTQLMVYSLADSDTNKDQKLDENDIQSLYLSTLSGEKFTKISADLMELVDWKVIDANARLYYKTIEDSNKNGQIDTKDAIQYHYVNLLDEQWKPIQYFPIK